LANADCQQSNYFPWFMMLHVSGRKRD